MKKNHRKKLGNYGEELAQKAYEADGFQLIARQFRCRAGEIDLIMSKSNLLVFVEVRTKSSRQFGTGDQSVTQRKQERIRKVSQYFIHKHTNYDPNTMIRFDVVSIFIDKKQKKAWIKRIPEAF